MEFREADPVNAEAIRDVAVASLHATYDDILGEETVERAVDQWYDPATLDEDLADDRLHFLVAEDAGDVVAFAHVHRRERQEEGRIQWLHVDPDRRGEGVGGRLLEHVREHLRASGLERVTGEVLAANETGNEFYRAQGFSLAEQRTVSVGGGFEPENVYEDVAGDHAELRSVETPEGTMYVDEGDADRGRVAPWYPVYRSENGTRRYGWFCGACESADNAMDAMGRIECNDCENVRKATRWDATYL